MKITKKEDGDNLVIALDGRLDTTTAPELEELLKGSLGDIKELIFDMANLEYISSAGLRVLLFAKKSLHNKSVIKIVSANDIVKEVFELTGFDNVIEVL